MENNQTGNQAAGDNSQQAGSMTQAGEKTFTQEEVNRIVQERLARARQDSDTASAYRNERDEARRELEQYKNNAFLREKGVKADDMDYVTFKAEKLVDDKTDFRQAAEKFLKENPKYAGAGTYRVSTSVASGKGAGYSACSSTGVDDPMSIRKAMGLKG